MPRTIVLGYDGSECAKEALDVAVELARDEPESRIVVVHGHPVHVATLGGGPGGAYHIAGEVERSREHARPAENALLQEAAALISAAGVSVASTIEWKTPWHAVLDVAEEEDADMIVVGSHGLGATRGRVLGSVPHKLLNHSRIPVLVVPHRR